MDSSRLDLLTRWLAIAPARRQVLGGTAAAALGGLLGISPAFEGTEDVRAARNVKQCKKRCRRKDNARKRRRCKRRCQTSGASTPIGQGAVADGLPCSSSKQCNSGNCANIDSSAGVCAPCPVLNVCGVVGTQQCCVVDASRVGNICIFN